MGGLETKDISKIIKLLRKNWNGELGIHTHDNMSRAVENTNIATENVLFQIGGNTTLL